MLERYRSELDAALRHALSEGEPFGSPQTAPGLLGMLRYHMGWEDAAGSPTRGSVGKGLRPTLCLFTCEAVGGRAEQAVPAAVALEMVHNFSLIHDDIQDQDRERHHRPTVWALWGKPLALIAGNVMRTLADGAALDLPGQGVPARKAPGALAVLTARYLEMIEGQYLDLTFEERQEVSPAEYLDMVGRKTGALMEASLHLGAYLGTDDGERVEALRRCGRLLGLAFQARDDLLGIWGDPTLTGKAVGADLRRRKKSLPVVYAFQKAAPPQRARLHELYSQEELDEDAVAEVLTILDTVDAQSYTQALAEEKRDEALAQACQARLPPWAQGELESLAKFMLQRLH
jgi:geranylgeranyl diphosphate synthase type I